ncbi:MAG: nucleotide sugar dehydrogenase [Candidatus Binataceae bacterium]
MDKTLPLPDGSSDRARKVDTHQADLTIVGGAGHVGISLVLAFACAGLRVNINDRNQAALDMLAAGRLPFMEYGAETLLADAIREKRLSFTSAPGNVSRDAPVIVTIGTPVDEFLNPVGKVVQECIDELLPHLVDGQLLVLRSTLYPGTTDWIAKYVAHKGRHLKVAFCPERVVQGFGVKELAEMPQIISGTTPESEEEAARLFSLIVPEVVRVKPIEAELSKLFNNAYRYIEFATANQFYMIAKAAGADYGNILEAMRHNYPRAKGMPTAGFSAGPCLLKDTMQLAAFARNQFSLGHAAMLMNEGIVLQIVDDLRGRYDLSSMTVGLLGMAFKADIDDTRASLSYKFRNLLRTHADAVLTTDPFVTTDPDLLSFDEVVAKSDVLILCTPHSVYRGANLRGKPIVDIWRFFENANTIY